MSAPRSPRRAAAGFTLIEMMIAMVVLSLVMGATLSMLRSQSQGFRKGGSRMELSQNIRYALGTVARALRTTGAGTASSQPMLVYGGNDVVVVNANFASDLQDGNAVYINPDLPAGAVDGLRTTTPITIYGTAINYPAVNYMYGAATGTRAETISFFFQPDTGTATPNDFILFERVNAMPPEMVARNVFAYTGRPFFEYFAETTNAGVPAIQQVTAARTPASQALPIRHSANVHGGATDLLGSALADSIRLIRINMTVTNGLTGADSAGRQVSTSILMPNNGLAQLKSCGDQPVQTGALTATPPIVGFGVRLQWPRSPDELSGERDVSQYNVYYRVNGQPDWNTMVTIMPTGVANYDVTEGTGLVSTQTYDFAVASQDCTPQESPMLISALPYLVP